METKPNQQLLFLDVMIIKELNIKFKTVIYRKKAYLDKYTPIHITVYLGLLYTIATRAVKIVDD